MKDLRQRRTVVEPVTAFQAFHQHAGNEFVITGHVVGYPEVRASGKRTGRVHLGESLDDEDIENFVGT